MNNNRITSNYDLNNYIIISNPKKQNKKLPEWIYLAINWSYASHWLTKWGSLLDPLDMFHINENNQIRYIRMRWVEKTDRVYENYEYITWDIVVAPDFFSWKRI
jgi:hypothetical protein